MLNVNRHPREDENGADFDSDEKGGFPRIISSPVYGSTADSDHDSCDPFLGQPVDSVLIV